MWCPARISLRTIIVLVVHNDIYNSSDKASFFLADDTNLLYAGKNLRSLEITVNEELSRR